MTYSWKNLTILYEDNHLIAVNKPAGILVQGDETGDTPLVDIVKDYIKIRYDKPGDVFLGVIHRLDRPVSGVVIFARTSKALVRMNALFNERKIQKTYYCIVQQRPSQLEAVLTDYLVKDHEKNITRAYSHPLSKNKDAKKATLKYQLVAEVGKHFLLEVEPETGRSHQIRAQLSKIGTPIRGDMKYGSLTDQKKGSICLHAYKLEFEHPIKKEKVKIEAMCPKEDIWRLFNDYFIGL
ncbi:MAG: RluA family pseudouridine synthase [Saprospiraceae bacterium]|nr:RluA family pseudouridine synthase [Saprospiraceae bacterium]